MATGTQDYVGDPRNDEVLVSVDGAMAHRDTASVSVFDSGFVLGDGVWEGLRLVQGRIAFLDQHLDRLYDGAKMLMIDIGLTREALVERLFTCLQRNGMADGVHIRIMVTRGRKRSPYQDPRLTVGAATVVIIPEWKAPRPEMLERGISLFTVHVRRTGPARPGSEAEQPFQAERHPGLHPGHERGRRRSPDAGRPRFRRPPATRRHFFIVRNGEVWTSGGRLLPAGHHARRRAAGRTAGRDPGL